jgi:hypothetical protein
VLTAQRRVVPGSPPREGGLSDTRPAGYPSGGVTTSCREAAPLTYRVGGYRVAAGGVAGCGAGACWQHSQQPQPQPPGRTLGAVPAVPQGAPSILNSPASHHPDPSLVLITATATVIITSAPSDTGMVCCLQAFTAADLLRIRPPPAPVAEEEEGGSGSGGTHERRPPHHTVRRGRISLGGGGRLRLRWDTREETSTPHSPERAY